MLNSKISASIMCGDMLHFSDVVKILENSSVDLIHVDIMDGSFVPNFTFGPDFCNALRKATDIPLDIHFMVNRPENFLYLFRPMPREYVSVHAESTPHVQKALSMIKSYGAKAAVALNPSTPLCALDHLLPDIDMVLIMTVNPGFAGQTLIPQLIGKVADCRSYLDQKGYSETEIEVDGNISFENARTMKAAGANIFVSGSSGIFSNSLTLKDAVLTYRQKIAG